MKRSHVFILFYCCTPILLVARCLQRFYMVDGETGFFRDGFSTAGGVITAAFLVFTLVMWLLCRLDQKEDVALPERSLPLAVGSFTAALFLAASAVTQLLTETGNAATLSAMASLLFAATLLWRGLALLGRVVCPVWVAPVGTFYALLRLIVRFAAYAGEVTVSDALFDILTMCLLLLFFFDEGKLLAGMAGDRVRASFRAWGFCGALFCLGEFFPILIDRLLQNKFDLHGSGIPDLAYIGFAALLILEVHAASPRNPSSETA